MEKHKPISTEEITPHKKAFLPEYISMYDISGQDKITERSFGRYLKDKEQDQKIKDQIEHSAAFYEKRIVSAPRDARSGIIQAGLAEEDVSVKLACAALINRASTDTQAGLRKEVLQLIKAGLAEDDILVQRACAEMIPDAPEDAQDNLKKKVSELIQDGFAKEDTTVQKNCAEMILYAPYEQRASFIQAGLAKKDPAVQKAWAEKIVYAPIDAQKELREKVSQLVKEGLDKEDPVAQKACVELVWYASKNDQVGFIQDGLAKEDVSVQKAWAKMIEDAPVHVQDGLREKITQLVKAGLDKEDPATQMISAEMIRHVPLEASKSLFQLARQKLGDVLVEPALYTDEEISKDVFQRVKFFKTGSETTLIGGQLKGKTIIRHLQPEAFLAWQKLYEDHVLWQQAGFDYVPIEPIQSYRLNKKGLVDVYSGVLDLSLGAWEQMTDDFGKELTADQIKIQSILKKQNVKHGHPHVDNFCLRFFRDENGSVDFSKKPRIYLIDFDVATSSSKK